jgi:hypothetical protein
VGVCVAGWMAGGMNRQHKQGRPAPPPPTSSRVQHKLGCVHKWLCGRVCGDHGRPLCGRDHHPSLPGVKLGDTQALGTRPSASATWNPKRPTRLNSTQATGPYGDSGRAPAPGSHAAYTVSSSVAMAPGLMGAGRTSTGTPTTCTRGHAPATPLAISGCSTAWHTGACARVTECACGAWCARVGDRGGGGWRGGHHPATHHA